MRRSKFSDEQKIKILRLAASGMKVTEICRREGISEQTFYRWRQKLGGMTPSDAKKLRQLEDENRRLKQMVADLSLDKVALEDLLKGNW